jgi:hypothetical protein
MKSNETFPSSEKALDRAIEFDKDEPEFGHLLKYQICPIFSIGRNIHTDAIVCLRGNCKLWKNSRIKSHVELTGINKPLWHLFCGHCGLIKEDE